MLNRSVMSDSATPWTAAHQAPLSMEFSRQGYWGGLSFSPPGDLPNTGIEPGSPALQAGSLLSEPPGEPWEVGVIKERPSLLRKEQIIQPSGNVFRGSPNPLLRETVEKPRPQVVRPTAARVWSMAVGAWLSRLCSDGKWPDEGARDSRSRSPSRSLRLRLAGVSKGPCLPPSAL